MDTIRVDINYRPLRIAWAILKDDTSCVTALDVIFGPGADAGASRTEGPRRPATDIL